MNSTSPLSQATNKTDLTIYIIKAFPEWSKGFSLYGQNVLQSTMENVSTVFVYTLKVNGVQNIIDFHFMNKKCIHFFR